jgi:hypothetical protein
VPGKRLRAEPTPSAPVEAAPRPRAADASATHVGGLARTDLATRARTIGALQQGAGNAAVSRALLAREEFGFEEERFVEDVGGGGFQEERIVEDVGGGGFQEERIVEDVSGGGGFQEERIVEDVGGDGGGAIAADEIVEDVGALTGPEAAAAALEEAMAGLGTDEAAIQRVLGGAGPAEFAAIEAAYRARTGRELRADLQSELSAEELRRLPMFRATGPAAVAEALNAAMAGLGTDEEAIFAALSGRTPEDLAAIRAAYLALTGRALVSDLRDELSGPELDRALALLGAG